MNLKKSLVLFLCLALLLTSGVGVAFASAKVSAKILSLEGDVQVIRAGGEKPFKAFVNMRLTEGDQVITGTNGRVEIQMDDEVVITLVENTRIYLSELRGSGGAQQSSIGLQAGGVASSVSKKLEENSRFEIKTPTAVMGVRGTEFFTQYFSGNVDVRVIDGIVEVTVELTETGQVTPGGGSSWSGSGSGSGAGPGDPSAPGAETFTFQLGPLSQVLFGEGSQGSQLPGQIMGLTLQGLPEKFIERIQEIEQGQPGKIPGSIMGELEEAIQEALDRLREQEEVARGNLAEYDSPYSAGIIDGDLVRDLPGFAPAGMGIPPLDPEPTDTGGGGGSTVIPSEFLYELYTLVDPDNPDDKIPFDENTQTIELVSNIAANGIAYIFVEELVGDLGLTASLVEQGVVEIFWDPDRMILEIEAIGGVGGSAKVNLEGYYNVNIV